MNDKKYIIRAAKLLKFSIGCRDQNCYLGGIENNKQFTNSGCHCLEEFQEVSV